MEIPSEALAGIASALLTIGAFLGGRPAADWWQRRRDPASRPLGRPRSPTPPPPIGCSPTVEAHVGTMVDDVADMRTRLMDVEQQTKEVHEIVARRDDFGGSKLLRSLDETAKNTAAMRECLDEIRSSLRPRPPMGSQPGAAE